ncbi:Nuclear export receptor CSE1/CAS (importin beta superfamily) [Ceraceosorus bombacis]|uniref:Nuclear export receptor CSE1/CAS (Importin beta superfamily) n=1 Tax=Ceraceosorus bombacis TaxID=401625 RepID=A0A0P1BJG7_9BASI|nr:Nuclear export receptor CSE1/CAS (importin beta superfamily) [Ceraceosorus bombacis]
MASLSGNLGQLAALFSQTLNPSTRREAEQNLTDLESNRDANLSALLLDLIASPGATPPVRLAAAVKLKNICRRAWAEEDDADLAEPELVQGEAREALKTRLVPLLGQLSSDVNVANAPGVASLRIQLSECVALIAARDFPQQWPALLDELVGGLALQPDSTALAAVLQTCHSIFRRWRAAFRSNVLYEDINLVLAKFAKPYLDLLQRTDAALQSATAGSAATLGSTLVLVLQIYHDLSAQDLPPDFEENISSILPLLLRYLHPTSVDSGLYVANQALAAPLEGDPDDASPAAGQKARAEICAIAELYAQRYLDVFETFVPQYVKAVWEMLGQAGRGEKFDLLVTRAISFLSTVVRMPSQRATFESEATLEAFIQAIILPNISLREQDEEMFEDEPIEWVRREFATVGIEGGDNDTRRKSATTFTKALLEVFPQQITAIILRYINQYLQEYAAAPQEKWRGKDTAVYLLSSIASTGGTSQGASSMNALVNVVQWFSDNVFGDLQADSDSVHPILQVDAIKYLHTFRQQLTKEQLLSVLPLLVRHLESQNYVTCSYAAITIERVLFLKQQSGPETGKLLFSSEDVQPFAESILMALYRNILGATTPEKMAENDYLMKCVMRVILTCRERLAPFYQPILESLNSILTEISKNPSNPKFSQYTFESIAALIRYVAAADPNSIATFESTLSRPFSTILQGDVAEFAPYVFQILAQMLELHKSTDGSLPEIYTGLLPSLLTPTLWASRGNVPALVRLLQAYLDRGSAQIVAEGRIGAMLGIYQQLIASKINDEHGFALLNSLFENLPKEQMNQYRAAVLTLMLNRLQTNKTEKFSRVFVEFLARWACVQQDGYPSYVIQSFDAVQPGLFPQIVDGIVIGELAKIPQRTKRLVAVGFSRLLTESPEFLHTPNANAWPSLLSGILRLLQDRSIASTGDSSSAAAEEIFAQDWEETGFQASFSVIVSSAPPNRDWTSFANAEPVEYLSRGIAIASKAVPGVVPQLLSRTNAELRQPLEAYIAQSGLSIS